MDEPKSVIRLLKTASKFDVFLIVFLSLPFVLSKWIEIVNGFDLADNANPDRVRLVVCILVTVAYVACIALLMWGTFQDRRLRLNADIISNILAQRGNRIGSAAYLQDKTGIPIGDDEIEKLIRRFPNRFRRVRIKGEKNGLGLVDVEEDEG